MIDSGSLAAAILANHVTALSNDLLDAVRWLDAIESEIGLNQLFLAMPNGCAGRKQMIATVEAAKAALHKVGEA